jgi:hypothetical protein
MVIIAMPAVSTLWLAWTLWVLRGTLAEVRFRTNWRINLESYTPPGPPHSKWRLTMAILTRHTPRER